MAEVPHNVATLGVFFILLSPPSCRIRDHIYRRSGRFTLNSRYIVDKLLSESQVGDPSSLREAPARIILLARRPEQALPSLLETGWDMVDTEEKALEHYRERLISLRNIARVLEPSQGVFVTYRYLVAETESALPKFSHFLDLEEVLTEDYQTMWSTGVAGLGDTSRRIEEGRVVREQRAYSVQVDDKIMAEARHLFHDLMGAVERLALPKVSGSENAE